MMSEVKHGMYWLNSLKRRTVQRINSSKPDAGISLIEVMVSMMILAVLMAATLQLAVGFERTTGETRTRQDQVDVGRAASEAMVGTLRTSVMPSQLSMDCATCLEDAFVKGSETEVQFYANYRNPKNSVGPSRVTYTLVTTGAGAGELTERIQKPTSANPTATGYQYCNAEATGAGDTCAKTLSKRIIGRGVKLDAGTRLFTFYDKDGKTLTPSGSGLSKTQLAGVVSIEITITTQTQNAIKVNPTTYIQRITLPNAQAVLRNEKEEE